MEVHIKAITPQCSEDLEPSAAASTFWALPPAYGTQRSSAKDPLFDKQVWLQNVLLEWGICGYTAFVSAGGAGTRPVPAATVFFAPARYMQGIANMPTGPISPDAILLSTVHVAVPYMGLYLEHQLIDTVLTEAHRRGVKAVEAFARVEDFDEEFARQLNEPSWQKVRDETKKEESGYSALESLKYVPESYRGWKTAAETHGGNADILDSAPMLSEDILEAEGFKVVKHHRHFPRYRFEINGPHSLFGDFAEEDHAQVNGPEKISTVIGGNQTLKVTGTSRTLATRGNPETPGSSGSLAALGRGRTSSRMTKLSQASPEQNLLVRKLFL